MMIRKNSKLKVVKALQLVLLVTGIYSLSTVAIPPEVRAGEIIADLSEDYISSRFLGMDFMFDAEPNAEFLRRARALLTYSNGHSDALLNRMAVYLPLIEKELRDRGLPEELKYLTITESSVNPTARSRAGAVGLWQIMLGTARHLGLRVNRLVDERRDPQASTLAALDYLEFLYGKYGDWKLTLAAYNAGPGRVDQAIRRANSNDFNQVRRFLPLETRNYIPNFMAAAYFGKFHQVHGLITEIVDYDMILTDVIRIYEQISFSEISEISGVDAAIIRKLNPMFLSGYVPSSRLGYNLILPLRGIVQMESAINTEGINSIGAQHQRIFKNYIEAFYLIEESMSWTELGEKLYLNPYQLYYLNLSKSASGLHAGDQVRYVIPRFSGFYVKAIENEEIRWMPLAALQPLPFPVMRFISYFGYDLICSALTGNSFFDLFQRKSPLPRLGSPEVVPGRGQSESDLERIKLIQQQRDNSWKSAYVGD